MYDFVNLLQAQQYGYQAYLVPSPYATPPQESDPSQVQTPIEESGRFQPTAITVSDDALKLPTPVSEPEHQRVEQEETIFSRADRFPDRFWKKLMDKLEFYGEKWARNDAFDPYIKLRMEEEGPPYLGWKRFWLVVIKLHEEARHLSAVRGNGAIRTAYTLMMEKGCEKMCNVMQPTLLEM